MSGENWIPCTTMADRSRGYIVETDSNSDRSRHAKVDWEGYREDEWKMGFPPPPHLRPTLPQQIESIQKIIDGQLIFPID